jgi:hypothetical protein
MNLDDRKGTPGLAWQWILFMGYWILGRRYDENFPVSVTSLGVPMRLELAVVTVHGLAEMAFVNNKFIKI